MKEAHSYIPTTEEIESGWTISPEFLKSVRDHAEVASGWSVGLEETEAILLAAGYRDLQSENTRLREQLAEKDKEILVIESLQRSDLPIFYNQAILEVVSVLKGKPVGYAKETLKS